MTALTIQLDENTAATVRQFAAEERRSENEVVRDALALYAQLGKRPLPQGLGQYHSGQSDVSAKARDLLRDAAREGQWP